MSSIFYKRVKSYIVCFIILSGICFLGAKLIVRPLKFIVLSTNIVYGNKEKHYVTMYRMYIHYNYEIDGKTFNGTTATFYKNSLDREAYKIRYLIKDPSVSIIDDTIIWESVLWLFPFAPVFFGISVLLLAFFGKLPKKYQNSIDNYVSS